MIGTSVQGNWDLAVQVRNGITAPTGGVLLGEHGG